MRFKSATQPLCRQCGGKIPKLTGTTFFDPFEGAPKTRDEAQRLVNQAIISIRYDETGDGSLCRLAPRVVDGQTIQPLPANTRYVRCVGTWDGESYVDNFFCNGDHAKAFGYAAVTAGFTADAYTLAHARQQRQPPRLLTKERS